MGMGSEGKGQERRRSRTGRWQREEKWVGGERGHLFPHPAGKERRGRGEGGTGGRGERERKAGERI